jgi:16S rRNA (cytosine967-C5)-methyltransferase
MVADATTVELGSYDIVLLDAPCSATGTIRRHPELPYIRTAEDIAALAGKQRRLLGAAARRVKDAGRLLYCTCSLERDEGEDQVAWFLESAPGFHLARCEGLEELGPLITDAGCLRTFPHSELAGARGMDGFFAAILFKRESGIAP